MRTINRIVQYLPINASKTILFRFNHGDSFTPKSRFDFDFTPTGSDTQITDSRNFATAVTVSLTSADISLNSLIEAYQPIAQLRGNFFYSSNAGIPACI